VNDRPLAIFDLDGTLTTQNTFLAFLVSFCRRRRRWGPLLRMPWPCGLYVTGLLRDWQLKERLMRDVLEGIELETIAEHARWLCKNWLPRKRHQVGTRLLEHHLAAGHRCVLLSASPDLYVPQIAASLGIGETVCTRVASRDGRCLGTLSGENCKGPAKLTALTDYLGCDTAPAECYAYGDSEHDRAVLEWAGNGWFVRRTRLVPVSGGTQTSPLENDHPAGSSL
jgi:phosphatidylglycerophosphatase C